MGLFTNLFAYGEDTRGAALDAKLIADHQAKLKAGKESQDAYNAFLANEQNQASTTYDGQIQEAFVQGAQEGLQREQNAVKKSLWETIKGTLGFVPWYAWLGLGAWGLWQLGLFKRSKA